MVAPAIIAALIGAGSSLIGKQMDKQTAEDQLPAELLAQLNPGQSLQGLETSFAIPGMQQPQSPGQRLLGGF